MAAETLSPIPMQEVGLVNPVIEHMGFSYDVLKRELIRPDGKLVRLRQQPGKVFTLLLANPGKVVTYEEFRKFFDQETRSLPSYSTLLRADIWYLRKQIGDKQNTKTGYYKFIQTIPGVGVYFSPPSPAFRRGFGGFPPTDEESEGYNPRSFNTSQEFPGLPKELDSTDTEDQLDFLKYSLRMLVSIYKEKYGSESLRNELLPKIVSILQDQGLLRGLKQRDLTQQKFEKHEFHHPDFYYNHDTGEIWWKDGRITRLSVTEGNLLYLFLSEPGKVINLESFCNFLAAAKSVPKVEVSKSDFTTTVNILRRRIGDYEIEKTRVSKTYRYISTYVGRGYMLNPFTEVRNGHVSNSVPVEPEKVVFQRPS